MVVFMWNYKVGFHRSYAVRILLVVAWIIRIVECGLLNWLLKLLLVLFIGPFGVQVALIVGNRYYCLIAKQASIMY